VLLGALAALAAAPLAGLLVRVWSDGGVLSGGEGFVVVDQAQYLAWIRQVADHGLIANPFDLAPGERAFLHPGLLPSGVLHALGLGIVPAFALLKLPAVALLALGAAAWVRRHVATAGARAVALALALLAVSPLSAVISALQARPTPLKLDLDFLEGELWSGTYLWGYPFTATAVGLLALALLAYERGRSTEGGGRWLVAAALAGLACAWLQPWQGATLALIVVAGEAFSARRRLVPAAVVLSAVALPLLYYLVLSRADPSWELAGEVNQVDRWPLWLLALGLAPLGLPALLGVRERGRGFGEVALLAWIPSALAVYFLPFGTFAPHALQGLAIPLAVLAVRGLAALRAPRAAVLAGLALMVVPGTVYRVDQLEGAVRFQAQPYVLASEERAALRWLDEAPEAGGVLAPVFTGVLVPGYTGRETWVGPPSWTPGQPERERAAEDLFAGRLDRAAAERVVRRSGARFLLSDCHGRRDIAGLVRRVATPARRMGCAVVYRVAP